MVKLVIFDNNGTLENDLDLAFGSVVEIFNRYSLKSPSLEQYRNEISARFMDFYYRHGFNKNFSGKGDKGDIDALNQIREEYGNKIRTANNALRGLQYLISDIARVQSDGRMQILGESE